MGLIEDLAKIRERQGKEPLPSPFEIQGFGVGHPPPPAERPPTIEPEDFPDDDDVEYVPPQTLRSPLVPARPEPKQAETPQAIAGLKLIVLDKLASYSGVETNLTDDELRQISVIVIGAQQRVLKKHLEDLETPKALPANAWGDGLDVTDQGLLIPKKRGRPKKT